MEHSTDPETEFWCKILYSIGVHVMDVTRTSETINPVSLSGDRVEDDTISKVFRGYWILMIILDIFGRGQSEDKEENEDKGD